jgi:hypothetical protein
MDILGVKMYPADLRPKHPAHAAAMASGMTESEFKELQRKADMRQSQVALDNLKRAAYGSNEKPE